MKNTTAWGPSPRARYPLTVSGSQLRNWKILALPLSTQQNLSSSRAQILRVPVALSGGFLDRCAGDHYFLRDEATLLGTSPL